jgi:phytoene/squalene synthetase
LNPRSGSLQNKTSFYYPLLLLGKEKRQGMELLYRFCWMADEISDGPGSPQAKRRKLSRFKRNLREAFQGKPKDLFFLQFQSAIRKFGLTPSPLERIVRGIERDLRPIRFRTFGELHRYALQVAGGPGLASMEIFGFKDRPHRDYAENLGVFLQLVNMVRDYEEDRALGRQYFPAEDFRRFHLDPNRIDEKNSNWRPFVEFQLGRAWNFLERSRRSLTLRQRAELRTAEAISAVYIKLFQKLRDRPHCIRKGKIRLSNTDKFLSAAGAMGRCMLWKYMN